ncbi:sodium:solute symporter family transporter [Rhizorhabdus dicambivorans]|uniref:Sodium transporter n=1 Tax=Rhizorhabdus dicambivorans TaxID=1850238 RepID=A0A2A4G1H1_9SPHN|nr:sodium/solute symporter [Rhizorhabdus dicambivorans]ATE65057.1 sodium transporter [Rhizorhabdus dicambivorans]PCE44331.1 sodium transporter [Rhizorhabdus dicambivorans]
MHGLVSIDYAVIGFYGIGLLLLAVAGTHRGGGANEYFLASRAAGWPMVGLSLLASNISSTTMVGLAGAAYLSGISVYNYEWMAAVVLVIFVALMLPSLLASGVFTMPELLERRYDRPTRLYFAGLTLFLNFAVDAAGTLYAGAFLLKLLYPGVELWIIVAALALTAGAYTVAGGMRAVLYTEVMQALILLGGSAVIAVAAFDHAGGWSAITAAVPPEKLSLIRPLDDPTLPWLGLLTGVPILGFYFWCTNQFMVQRVLAARSLDHGRWGCLFAGLLKLPVLWLMVLPGTAALLIAPGLDRADLVYPTLLFDLIPNGFLGVVIAGFLAAAMSSLAATFNAAATIVTIDFVRPAFPGIGDRAIIRCGRIATIVFMAAAVAWAPQVLRFPSLWQYLQSVLAYAVPPVVVLFLAGMLWRRASSTGAHATILTGLATGAALFLLGPVSGRLEIHFLYAAPIILSASTAAMILASLIRPAVDSSPLLWTRAHWAAESAALTAVPWWKNYRIQGVGLLVLTGAIVFAFR